MEDNKLNPIDECIFDTFLVGMTFTTTAVVTAVREETDAFDNCDWSTTHILVLERLNKLSSLGVISRCALGWFIP